MTKVPYRHFVPLPPKEEAKSHVILNEVKNPTEELTGIYSSLGSWDISLALNMTKVPYRHFVPLRLRGGRAPFVAMRHFPRFSGGSVGKADDRG